MARFTQNVQTMDFNETEPNPFAVCRTGVLLKVIVAVQLPVALGALSGSDGLLSALQRWAQASVVSVPATLLWLLLVCWAGAWLGRWRPATQVLLAGGLGGVVVWLFLWPRHWIEQALGEPVPLWWPWIPPILTGAAMGMVVAVWLRGRAKGILPTEAQARLAELQARIRPHFLFNTLNTAIALVQVDPQRAEAVLEDLAELFREALASPHARSTLGQEVRLAQRYLDIEALRFGERLRVHWDVDASLSETVVPALVLQPLVENAVRHGVEPAVQGGWVQVRVRRDGGGVEVLVTNSMPSQAGGPSHTRGQGMALANVRQRLHLMYDLEAALECGVVDSNQPDVLPEFRVRMVLPVSEGS